MPPLGFSWCVHDPLIGARPEDVPGITASGEAQKLQARQSIIDRQFSTALGTRHLNESTEEQGYRNKMEPISATVDSIIHSGQDQITQANYELRGDDAARQKRIDAIRQNTLTMIQGEITKPMQYGGSLQEVSAYVMGGDHNNRGFQDYQDALGLKGGAARALENADTQSQLGNTGDNPTAKQIQDLQAKMEKLITTVTTLQ